MREKFVRQSLPLVLLAITTALPLSTRAQELEECGETDRPWAFPKQDTEFIPDE